VNDSHVTPVGINRSTCLPQHFRELPLDVLGLANAYARAKEMHAAMPARQGLTGYRIFVVFRESVGSLDLPASPDAYVILGRHTHCDMVLDAEPTVALRHLLVRAIRQPDGTVGVRMLDLQTSLAFYVDDGAACRSIFAIGPIAVRLGPYAIVALPLDPSGSPPALPRPTISRATSMELGRQGGPYRAAASKPGEMFRSSHITILPVAPSLEDLPMASARAGFGRLTLDGTGRMASIEVPEEELGSGILLGRALKCKDEGLRPLLDTSISRAHLLLLREEGLTCAFDLASTRGTFAYGVRVRRALLPDTGGTLSLANPYGLRLHWHRRV
jgi:hypothetical protein